MMFRRRPDSDRDKVLLKMGAVFIARQPTCVETVLGSCISVCLFCPKTRLASINHATLPQGENEARFVNVSLPYMLDRLVALGASKQHLQAKVFGGANMFRAFYEAGNHVGKQNVDAALHWLELNRIPVLKSDVGGHFGRKIVFLTDEGRVFVKKLDSRRNEQLLAVGRSKADCCHI